MNQRAAHSAVWIPRVYYRSRAINIFTLIFCLISFIPTVNSAAQPSLTLTTFAGPPLSNNDQTGFYDLVLKEAFHRAGVAIDISQLPAERSLINANDGITDGDFVRIAGLDSVYPNLLRIPEKIADFEFVGFSRNVSISTPGWKSLQPYDVAIVRGWKILEKNIVGSRSLVRTKDQRLLFTLLEKNRADIVVYSRFEGYGIISQLGMKGVHVLEPPLAVREMFLYLNRKHQALVPVIANHLKEMKRDGTYAAIKEKTLAPFLFRND
jgi:polar amino acid transport system substrate-binding protein